MTNTLGKLEGKASIDFESVTGAHIRSQIELMNFDVAVTLLSVEVDIYAQTVQPAGSNRVRRSLQQGNEQVQLDVGFQLRRAAL